MTTAQPSQSSSRPSSPSPSSLRLMIGATGVVFGDIGTSPLYAFRESFIGHHRLSLDAPHVLGVLSMLVWALILVVTVKYVFVTMHADNSGEGGSFALLALSGGWRRDRGCCPGSAARRWWRRRCFMAMR